MSLLSPLSNSALKKAGINKRLDSLPKDKIEMPIERKDLLPRHDVGFSSMIENEENRASLYWTDYKQNVKFCRVYLRRRQFHKLWLHRLGYSNNEIASLMKIDPADLRYELKKCFEILTADSWTSTFFDARCKSVKLSP